MDTINISTLVNEVLAGSSRAVIAMLILIIIALLNEIRLARKDNKDVLDKIDAQRDSFLAVINDMQSKFSEKSEDMLDKYHKTLISQNESNGKVREVLSNIANLHINNRSDNP